MHFSLRSIPILCVALSSLAAGRAEAAASPPVPAKPFAASEQPFQPPARPASTHAYWHAGKVVQKNDSLVLLDAVEANSIPAPAWIKLVPGSGFALSGEQTSPARATAKETVTPRLLIGVDLKPSGGGAELQTFLYLYGYCEFRYRLSRDELTFNVWQGGPKAAGSVSLPLTPAKWNRIQARIDGDKISLTVNGRTAEAKIGSDWSAAPTQAPIAIGFGGEDRPFMGSFNHLYLAESP